jgi:hypothetical protein
MGCLDNLDLFEYYAAMLLNFAGYGAAKPVKRY